MLGIRYPREFGTSPPFTEFTKEILRPASFPLGCLVQIKDVKRGQRVVWWGQTANELLLRRAVNEL